MRAVCCFLACLMLTDQLADVLSGSYVVLCGAHWLSDSYAV